MTDETISTTISGDQMIDIISSEQGNNTEILPLLITTEPKKDIITDTGGRIDPLSIDSYNVTDQNSDMTFCSYISYLNLKHITALSDEFFVRGNAIEIWTNLSKTSNLSGTQEEIFTGTHVSPSKFIEYLSGSSYRNHTTLFDIVTLKPKSDSDQST
jgi:hypothetical protein